MAKALGPARSLRTMDHSSENRNAPIPHATRPAVKTETNAGPRPVVFGYRNHYNVIRKIDEAIASERKRALDLPAPSRIDGEGLAVIPDADQKGPGVDAHERVVLFRADRIVIAMTMAAVLVGAVLGALVLPDLPPLLYVAMCTVGLVLGVSATGFYLTAHASSERGRGT